MNDFSFRRDIKYVKWNSTLWLNFLRATVAGVVWSVFGIIAGQSIDVGAITVLLGFAVVYFLVFLPIGLVFSFLSDLGVPFTGMITAICAFLVVVADPFVFLIHKLKPEIIPVNDYGFFNFILVIFVMEEEQLKVA